MVRGGAVGPTLGFALLCVLVAASVPTAGVHGASSVLAAAGQIDSDTVLIDVSVQSDGDADWAIRYRVRLDDDNATAAFESLEQDVEANRSAYAGQFGTRIQTTIAAAENATGRDMAVGNVSVQTSRQEIPQRYGVLTYSFEWSNFAQVDGPQIAVGDAIAGLYLDEATSLAIDWPPGYAVVSTDPAPDESGDRSATWQGPMEFSAEQPRLVVSSAASTEATTSPSEGETALGVSPLAIGAGAVAGLVVLFGGALWWRRREPAAGPTDPSGSPTTAEPDEELLSNEERVLRLLETHGGRMKQQQVVEELGWTDAKTSQVVGDLRESGEVEGFRLGRENVLRLPEAGDDVDS